MLDNLKAFLGIEGAEREVILKLIISDTTERLQFLIGGVEPPDELNYIILGVSIKRYNRLGSEGYTSHSVEGESITFNECDFDEYKGDIEEFLKRQNESKHGKVRFI